MPATTDAPPSYAQVIGDIEDIIKKLPDKAKEKALEAMKTEMQKSETTSKLVAEVKRLADGASEVSRLFDSVTLKLVKADAKKYKGVEELTPGWKDLRQVSLDYLFADSLDHSYRCARDSSIFSHSRERRPRTPMATYKVC